MEIIFLGTSAGVPTQARNVSATAVKKRNAKGWYLVDCGEGTQQRVLHTKLSLNRLEAILITHTHGDHCYGLPGLLASASMAGRERSLTIAAPRPGSVISSARLGVTIRAIYSSPTISTPTSFRARARCTSYRQCSERLSPRSSP
ncbi:MBL fold metallo-hydrolase [Modicisalibacter muralis]|uniref:MBL fold metallo-hydrolase n=1 Tax=Modicisalibacter muralis TaxID=119000 RepID=UPI000B0FC394|nr:MBL fold metallo-hydrolase [Halomonas muralis]